MLMPLLIAQITLAVLLTGAVLLQAQGTGLGSMWGGSGETFHTRRGIEKVLYYFSMVGIALFAVVSILIVAQ